jgi:hypothetical protein
MAMDIGCWLPVQVKKRCALQKPLVECQPSPSPVFLKIGRDEEFDIHVGPGSRR